MQSRWSRCATHHQPQARKNLTIGGRMAPVLVEIRVRHQCRLRPFSPPATLMQRGGKRSRRQPATSGANSGEPASSMPDSGRIHQPPGPPRPKSYGPCSTPPMVSSTRATYHRAATARDRDKLRQAVLEGLGWRIHRIWSTDWWQNPDGELEKVLAAIEQATEQRSRELEPPPQSSRRSGLRR